MELKGYLFAAGAGLLWGLLGLYGVTLNRFGYSGHEIAFTRMVFAFIAGMIYMLSDKNRRKSLKVKTSGIKYIFAIGIGTQALMNLFMYTAVLRVGTVTTTMLVCSGPIFTVLLSSVLFKEKLTLEKQLALSIAMLGSVLMITQGKIFGLKLDVLGVTLGIAAALCYGVYPILGKKAEKHIGTLPITVYSFLMAALFLAPFVDLKKMFMSYLDIRVFGVILTFGLIPSLIAYLLFLNSLNFIIPSKASIIGMLEIPTAATIGVFILNEEFNEYKLMGLVLIMVGISITRMDFSRFKKKFYRITEA